MTIFVQSAGGIARLPANASNDLQPSPRSHCSKRHIWSRRSDRTISKIAIHQNKRRCPSVHGGARQFRRSNNRINTSGPDTVNAA